MTNTVDYQVILISFPDKKTKETVTENEDGSYTIFIEASLSREEQQEEFLHAMSHILGGDFSKDNADFIERHTHCLNCFKNGIMSR